MATLAVLSANHSQVSDTPAPAIATSLSVDSCKQTLVVGWPILSTSGAVYDNTIPITYSGQSYLKCRHLFSTLTGTYTSGVVDIGDSEAANRHLVYVTGQDPAEEDIVITGEGTTWDDKFPSPTKWSEGNISTYTWSEIFSLSGAPSVRMRLYYGTSNPPTSYVDRLEILSAIIPATNRYFQLKITIVDPNINVFAYVEAYILKFCTYS